MTVPRTIDGGFMATRRHAQWLATTVLTVSLLAACGGSDDEPVIKPTGQETSAAAAPDPDGLSPEQREAFDAVVAYSTAVVGRGSEPVAPLIEDLVTPEVFDFIVPAETENVDQAGRQYIGTVKLTPTSVTVQGDTATVKGCQDGSAAYIVKKGDTQPGVGSRNLGSSRLDFRLVRENGRWLISQPESTPVKSC
ncbi:nuclear transport factor 2 family protein [Aeromicrobium wangtongii]|uniref:nuclear transport factor 2 family protein n=1 Tax=Aeromicrobium wangtongii TaxID=2969247 RepID=UPI0020182C42|nr:nuclear transport factor 2 family protein [Aeromicrobium wangtongii]MCL3818868.1 nuclear transport factor 2 family protein [Aeromicrobium wangtongii]